MASAPFLQLRERAVAEPKAHHGGEQRLRFCIADARQGLGDEQALDQDQQVESGALDGRDQDEEDIGDERAVRGTKAVYPLAVAFQLEKFAKGVKKKGDITNDPL